MRKRCPQKSNQIVIGINRPCAVGVPYHNAAAMAWANGAINSTHFSLDKMAATFADDIFQRIFLSANIRISTKFSPKFVRKGPTDNIPALVSIMAWRRIGDKPLSEPMLTRLIDAFMRN